MSTLLPYNSAGCFAPYEGHQVVEETAGKDTEVIALGGPASPSCVRNIEQHLPSMYGPTHGAEFTPSGGDNLQLAVILNGLTRQS